MGARTFQDSGMNMAFKLRGDAVIHSCFGCDDYVFPVCRLTGEDITHPVSGPVGEKCPLPAYHPDDEEDGGDAGV
jgi:hypothetical protein